MSTTERAAWRGRGGQHHDGDRDLLPASVTGARFSLAGRWIAITAGVKVGSTRVVVVRNVAAEIGRGPK